MDVIKEQLAKLRKEGKSPSIGDVTPMAKKEWAEIKAGKHPLYSQGSSKGKQSSSKKSSSKQGSSKKSSSKQNKTQKMSAPSGSTMDMDHTYCIEQMLKKVHLCKKDVQHIQKYLKTMKTQKGGDCGCSQTGGSCGSCQDGGRKKGRRTMKIKGMKGMKGKQSKGKRSNGKRSNGKQSKSMKGGSTDEEFVSIVDKETGEYNGPGETDGTNKEVIGNDDE